MAAFQEREVFLNVYNLGQHNRWLSGLGLGAYHSAVEISGREYTFSNDGVLVTTGRTGEEAALREKISLGTFQGSMNQINEVVVRLREDFAPGSYDVIRQNCNHFSDAFSMALLGKGIPGWINRMAGLLHWVPGSGQQAQEASEEEAADVKVSAKRRELTDEQRAILAKIGKKKGGS
uniref:PPPDE domain-containing protein n=1 Tax=Pinguiococcus pyrenoidosus TaxID=172671 RepID=A0A7R9UBZ3_9STRA|mmetsp:Transcript_4933/g.19736  ORF Transcript_4933/g.19736 Transcript_4933/m.19736 type:complete len:177 (+) Transcript_4933:36-566(+)